MAGGDLLLGVDVGATGIKVGAFKTDGSLVAVASRKNGPVPQPGGDPGWLIWQSEDIWDKVCQGAREVVDKLDSADAIRGVSVTGFGVDGVAMDAAGKQLYPMMSWHCTRTVPQCKWLSDNLDPYRIYQITGYHNYPIQTINRLLWLKENAPEVLDKCEHYLMVQDFIAFKFSGAFSTEVTIASTTLGLDLKTCTWSDEIFDFCGIDKNIFPQASESGRQIGEVTADAAGRTGIPKGTPVVTGGHDCEIGMLGSGVSGSDIFVDITGTWEMIIADLTQFNPTRVLYDNGIDWEAHSVPGHYLCQGLMMAGGVTEWLAKQLYADVPAGKLYPTMFGEAEKVGPGSGGVFVLPSFIRGMGPFSAHNSLGTILGLTTATERGQIVRATLESLCYQTRRQMDVIQSEAGVKCQRLRVLGGAQKNPLWLQLKADISGLPVEIMLNEEVTLLGAAVLSGVGAGVFSDFASAFDSIKFPVKTFEPDPARHKAYAGLYNDIFQQISSSLSGVYGKITERF